MPITWFWSQLQMTLAQRKKYAIGQMSQAQNQPNIINGHSMHGFWLLYGCFFLVG